MTAIQKNDWVTINEISKITGISTGQVRNILKTNGFKDIRRGKKLEKKEPICDCCGQVSTLIDGLCQWCNKFYKANK